MLSARMLEDSELAPTSRMTSGMLDIKTTENASDKYHDLVEWLAKTSGKTTFVSGNFNILHPGHLRMLRFAQETADRLVVGITPDGTPGVSVPSEVRVENFHSISIDLFPVLLTEPPAEFIRWLKPDFVVKGREFENVFNPEKRAVESYGGKLLFSSGESRFSSIATLRRSYVERQSTPIEFPAQYAERRNFTSSCLRDILSRFSNLRITVIGDVIVDEYIDCDPLGMSQEDPTIVVSPIEQTNFIGGGAIVAAHAATLGADVRFVSIVGDDQTADFVNGELDRSRVAAHLLTDTTRPTTRKQRFRAGGKTLLRVNHLRQHAVDGSLAEELVRSVHQHLGKTDLLLFADFNYGCLPQGVVDAINTEAREHGVMLAADSQASSQISDISRYRGMSVITPTEREARLAVGDFESGLVVLAERLAQKADAAHVLITLGAEGMLVYDHTACLTDRIPALNTAPQDVAGAGDSLFTCTAMSLRLGAGIWSSAYLGSLAAACQVSRVGNIPLNPAELVYELDRQSD